MCLLKTSKPQIQKSTNLCILSPYSMKIDIQALKYFQGKLMSTIE